MNNSPDELSDIDSMNSDEFEGDDMRQLPHNKPQLHDYDSDIKKPIPQQ